MTTTATRPAPPDLEFYDPDCSVCNTETSFDGTSRWCETCGATWNGDGQGGDWPDTERAVCASRYRDDGTIHRCCLFAEPVHDRHCNPEVCWGWHTLEQIDTPDGDAE